MKKFEVPESVMKKLEELKCQLEQMFPMAELRTVSMTSSGGQCKGCSGSCQGGCSGRCDGVCLVQ